MFGSPEIAKVRKKLRNYFQNENLGREYFLKFQYLFAIILKNREKEVDKVLFYLVLTCKRK